MKHSTLFSSTNARGARSAHLIAAAAFAAAAAQAVPEVTSCTMSQPVGSRNVTIEYALSEQPAVVTLDIQTNCVVNGSETWASIGGEYVWNAQGAVWRKVTGADQGSNGKYTIVWDSLAWQDPQGNGFKLDGTTRKARAVVTAWATDNTPDYMVVDIAEGAQPDTQRYYQSADFVPGATPGQKGAVTNNPIYKTTKLLMCKIMAKDVQWTMGSTPLEKGRYPDYEASHQVSLTNNYYIGVFEVTQQQWAMLPVVRREPSFFNNVAYRDMRPVQDVSYNEIRNSPSNKVTNADNAAYNWPRDPHPGSFLGLLRTRTGVDFDLPSEMQWEFACRAGNGDKKWGDGSAITLTGQSATTDDNLAFIGRYKGNGGLVGGSSDPEADCGPENGTAIVGSYAPNSWGIYDMHGNVQEWCLDWYENDISTYEGKVNIDPANPLMTQSGATGDKRVYRGGAWSRPPTQCRSAYRACTSPNVNGPSSAAVRCGLRLACRAGLN